MIDILSQEEQTTDQGPAAGFFWYFFVNKAVL